MYEFIWELVFSYVSNPFSFKVNRKSNGETLFDSSSENSDWCSNLVFKDKINALKSQQSYQKMHPYTVLVKCPNDPYTIYTADQSAINLNMDLYGSHPVYMDLRNAGGRVTSHGVLLLNSNGMDVIYRGNDSLT